MIFQSLLLGLCSVVQCTTVATANTASTAVVTGRLRATPVETPFFKGMEVILDGGFSGFVQADGIFLIHNVPIGKTYMLKVKSPKLTYPPVRIDVSSSGFYLLFSIIANEYSQTFFY